MEKAKVGDRWHAHDRLDASLAADTSALVGRDHGAFTAPTTGYDYGWDPSGAQFIAPEDGLFSVTAACQLYSSTTSSIARYTRLALVDVNSELVVSAPGPEAPCQPLGPNQGAWPDPVTRTGARGRCTRTARLATRRAVRTIMSRVPSRDC